MKRYIKIKINDYHTDRNVFIYNIKYKYLNWYIVHLEILIFFINLENINFLLFFPEDL